MEINAAYGQRTSLGQAPQPFGAHTSCQPIALQWMDLYVTLLELVDKEKLVVTHYTSLCFRVTIKSCGSVMGYHGRREGNEYISVLSMLQRDLATFSTQLDYIMEANVYYQKINRVLHVT